MPFRIIALVLEIVFRSCIFASSKQLIFPLRWQEEYIKHWLICDTEELLSLQQDRLFQESVQDDIAGFSVIREPRVTCCILI